MTFSTQRTVGERAVLFATVTAIATTLSFVFLKYKILPSAPAEAVITVSTLCGLVSAVLIDRMVGGSIEVLRVARLGTRQQRAAFLESAPSSADTSIRALLAAEHGEREAARLLLSSIEHIDARRRTPQEELAKLRFEMMEKSGPARRALLERILAWQPTHGGLFGLELHRYRAFVVAGALVDAPIEGLSAKAAAVFASSDDEHVRGYGTWLSESGAADAFATGAALAEHHDRKELAGDLQIRASRIIASPSATPYRGGDAT
jgi:hypothetical protein